MDNQCVNNLLNAINNVDSDLYNINHGISGLDNSINEINNSVKLLSFNYWEEISAIASIILAVIAVYAANRDYFNNLLFGRFTMPVINIHKDLLTVKQNNILISRLTIENSKKYIAKNVSFWAEELWHFENNNWEKASNFIHFPLIWTHTKSEYKDLYYARPYSLDFCQIIYNAERTSFYLGLCTPYGSPSIHGLDDVRLGDNRIKLSLYCDNHPIKHYIIEIRWDGPFNNPEYKLL